MKISRRLRRSAPYMLMGVLVLAVVAAYAVGPWRTGAGAPAAQGGKTLAPAPVQGIQEVAYGQGDRERLDVWHVSSLEPGEARPVIVWVHGGGWVGGSKSDVAPYLKVLAERGFTTVGVNYSLAPAHRYPTAVRQLNQAIRHVVRNAQSYHVDPRRIIVAGDSGGAHIAAQWAAAATNRQFAARLKIKPAVPGSRVRAVLAACGAFDLRFLKHDVAGIVRDYVNAYVGESTPNAAIAKASVGPDVTRKFPATWLSGGNADPLTPQVEAFAARLRDLGVRVQTVLWPKDYRPALIHEYQFDLSLDASQKTLESIVDFASQATLTK